MKIERSRQQSVDESDPRVRIRKFFESVLPDTPNKDEKWPPSNDCQVRGLKWQRERDECSRRNEVRQDERSQLGSLIADAGRTAEDQIADWHTAWPGKVRGRARGQYRTDGRRPHGRKNASETDAPSSNRTTQNDDRRRTSANDDAEKRRGDARRRREISFSPPRGLRFVFQAPAVLVCARLFSSPCLRCCRGLLPEALLALAVSPLRSCMPSCVTQRPASSRLLPLRSVSSVSCCIHTLLLCVSSPSLSFASYFGRLQCSLALFYGINPGCVPDSFPVAAIREPRICAIIYLAPSTAASWSCFRPEMASSVAVSDVLM